MEFSLPPDPGPDCSWSGARQRVGLRHRSVAPGCRVCPHGRCDHRALRLEPGRGADLLPVGLQPRLGPAVCKHEPRRVGVGFPGPFRDGGNACVVGERGLAENWSVGGRIRGRARGRGRRGRAHRSPATRVRAPTDVAVWSHHSRSLGATPDRGRTGTSLRPTHRQGESPDCRPCGRSPGTGTVWACRYRWDGRRPGRMVRGECSRPSHRGLRSMTRMRCQPPHDSRPTPGSPPLPGLRPAGRGWRRRLPPRHAWSGGAALPCPHARPAGGRSAHPESVMVDPWHAHHIRGVDRSGGHAPGRRNRTPVAPASRRYGREAGRGRAG